MFKPHLKYLRYVLRHKWFVGIECFKVGLYWRGLTHDWHKFLPSEWAPYVHYFYGERDEEAFDFAWLQHQKRADHHWQWWMLPEDEGGTKILPMAPQAWLEMLCDWCGVSRTFGHGDWKATLKWYQTNKEKIKLHPDTRNWVEMYLLTKAEGSSR